MANAAAADRVASAIGTIKWMLVGLAAIIGLLGFIGGLGGMVADGETASALAGIGILGLAFVYALSIWVLFGWFEHTLALLADIAARGQSMY